MEVKVGILAIGNEVVDGQITNRNAAWLAQQLENIGASNLYHLSCKDRDEEILDCLNFLEKSCHLVLVSGGLGPTKDDFTRQSLSKWLGSPLKIDEKLWTGIQEKLKSRDVIIRDGHKNQALIPVGATALENRTGVAPGFFIKSRGCFLASLPGPPNELQPMFLEQLKPLIVEHINPKAQKTKLTWICLGAPESEVAHIVESILGDDIEIGYRLHKPYVEVKAWVSDKDEASYQNQFKTLKDKLSPWLVGHSIAEIRKNFHCFLKSFENVFVIDQLTSGLLLEKLKEDFRSDHLRYQAFEHNSFRFFKEIEVSNILTHSLAGSTDKQMFIGLFPHSEDSVLISFNSRITVERIPRSISVKSKLGQLYAIEKLFLKNTSSS